MFKKICPIFWFKTRENDFFAHSPLFKNESSFLISQLTDDSDDNVVKGKLVLSKAFKTSIVNYYGCHLIP